MCVYVVGDTHTHTHISLHPTIPIEPHTWQQKSLCKISIIQICSDIFIFVFLILFFVFLQINHICICTRVYSKISILQVILSDRSTIRKEISS